MTDVSLSFRPGRITALIGENGAGKTTLARIAAGALQPDGGSIRVEGKSVVLRSPSEAGAAGIELVQQHFAIVPQFTVAENLALASSQVPALFSRTALASIAGEMIERSGLRLPSLQRRAADLSIGERAGIELAKALSREPRILILDEPTSVLSPPEVEELVKRMREVAARGTAVVLVTHRLREVIDFADEVDVMRGGRLVLQRSTADATPDELAKAMTGEGSPAIFSREPARQPGPPLLELQNVSTEAGGSTLHQVDLAVREGEIIAIVGVAGNGQRELAEAVRGLIPFRGTIRIGGEALDRRALSRAPVIGYIPSDRTRDGIVGEMDIAENLALADQTWSRRMADARAAEEIERYSIRTRGSRQLVQSLSGGNQQKVVLARELERHPRVVVAAEPTRGLDVRATRFVQERLIDAARRGAALLLLTSDLDEAIALGDAIHVMYGGRLGKRLPRGTDRGTIGVLMAGLA